MWIITFHLSDYEDEYWGPFSTKEDANAAYRAIESHRITKRADKAGIEYYVNVVFLNSAESIVAQVTDSLKEAIKERE